MAETKVTFQSGAFKLAGTVRVPEGVKSGEKRPAFIVMHGFGSNSSSSNVMEPCKMFEKLGYVTLRIDMPNSRAWCSQTKQYPLEKAEFVKKKGVFRRDFLSCRDIILQHRG